MPIYVLGVENAHGTRFQFNSIPRDEAHARERAVRAAVLVARFCSPDVYAGGRVVVTEAVERSLIAVVRVSMRRARKGVKS